MNIEDLCAYITQPEMKKTKKKAKKRRKDDKNPSGAPHGESAEERSTSVDVSNQTLSAN